MSAAKKGGQKQSKQPLPATTYDFRDIVLGKVRGYPSWPGMVVDPDSVPSTVQKERPQGKKMTVYCVRFFPKGDYAWLASKDISKLQAHEIQSYLNEPHKKSGELLEGYRIALDPKEWEESIEERLAAAGEAEANAEVDELEASEAESNDGSQKKATKKRKRESEVATTKAKGTKKARATKKGSEEPAPGKTPAKKGAAGGAKGRKSGGKSKAMVESEDEGEAAGEEEEEDAGGPSKAATSPPPAKKAKRGEKEEDDIDAVLAKDPEAVKVREWRHKLQKTFLSLKVTPKEEDMPAVHGLFSTVEGYEKMTVQYLQFSKIGKVMRHIAALNDDKVPRDAEFHFRDRAKALVDKWHHILNKSTNGTTTPGAPAVNGTTNDDTNGHAEAAQQDSGAGTGAVTDKTASLDLNGKTEEAGPDMDADAIADQPTTDAPAETGDVSMAEA